MSKRKKKDDADKPEKVSGGAMHYPEYHISHKLLKFWATTSRDHVEKRLYTDTLKKSVVRR